jgi:hypothetical protein
VNFQPGQTVPNRVVVPVGADGRLRIYNSEGSADVVVDVNGWYSDSSAAVGPSLYTGVLPVRVYDSRDPGRGPLGQDATLTLRIAGVAPVPAGASAVVMNVTVTNPSDGSYLTVSPSGSPVPLASDLNFGPGQTVPNLVMARLGPDGSLVIYNNRGSTDVIVDVFGWYS